MSYAKRWRGRRGAGVALIAMLAMAVAGVPGAAAQEIESFRPPVDIHSGTCLDPIAEPAYDAGDLALIPVEGEGDEEDENGEDGLLLDEERQAELLGEDERFDVADEGFLAGDVDDDGLLDIGFDADQDEELDEGEILGADVDADEALTVDEILVLVPVTDPVLQRVYKAELNLEDVDDEELIEEGPYVIIVHESPEDYSTYLACGDILALEDEDELVIPLRSYGGADYSGLAFLDDDELKVYLFQGRALPGERGGQDADVEADVEGAAQTVTLGQEGFRPDRISVPAGGRIRVFNEDEVDRVLVIEELGVEEDLAAGETVEIPIEGEPGEYRFASEGEDGAVAEGELTVE